VMSTNLVVVAPDDSVTQVREAMESAGVRRVPVVEDARLVGIISLKDLAEQVSTEAVGETTDKILEQDPNN